MGQHKKGNAIDELRRQVKAEVVQPWSASRTAVAARLMAAEVKYREAQASGDPAKYRAAKLELESAEAAAALTKR